VKPANKIKVLAAKCALMQDAEGRQVIIGPADAVERLIEGRSELSVLYDFHCLAAEARAQALHLTCSRDAFILREYVTQQMFGECKTLQEVRGLLDKRAADQSEQTIRLREVASWR
jgi:hypothetical protein